MATLAVVIFVLVVGGIIAGLAQYHDSDEPPITVNAGDSLPELHTLIDLQEQELQLVRHRAGRARAEPLTSGPGRTPRATVKERTQQEVPWTIKRSSTSSSIAY